MKNELNKTNLKFIIRLLLISVIGVFLFFTILMLFLYMYIVDSRPYITLEFYFYWLNDFSYQMIPIVYSISLSIIVIFNKKSNRV